MVHAATFLTETPGAAADCERILAGWGQPVNTATCLAFLAGAAYIWKKRRDLPMTLLVGGIGVGSIAFHGPMPPGAELLHDLGIAWTVAWIGLTEIDRRHWWLPTFAAAALASTHPVVADPSQAIAAAAVTLLQLRAKSKRRARLAALAVLGLGAVVGNLSRTGGPWCNPNSLWQGHGFWHLCSALALTIWAVAVQPEDQPVATGTAPTHR